MKRSWMWVGLVSCALGLSCAGKKARLDTEPCAEDLGAGDTVHCELPGWGDRSYDLVLPSSYDGTPVGLVLLLHGGGGNRTGGLKTTCPGKDLSHEECMHAYTKRAGYALVVPDGTEDNILPNVRTWNAGGGVGDYRCTSGDACFNKIDDIEFFRDLLAHVERRVVVDPRRIYATGLSNGGAMSHRLACELSGKIAAIAPIGGGMQLTVGQDCAPSRPVPVLHVHGTADTCWQYEGGVPSCAGGITGQAGKEHVSIERTMKEWSAINGCGEERREEALPDTDPEDGSTSVEITHQGCRADTVLLRVDGGGHTWPNGHQYLKAETIGPVWRDWGNERIIEWFDDHPMPQK